MHFNSIILLATAAMTMVNAGVIDHAKKSDDPVCHGTWNTDGSYIPFFGKLCAGKCPDGSHVETYQTSQDTTGQVVRTDGCATGYQPCCIPDQQ